MPHRASPAGRREALVYAAALCEAESAECMACLVGSGCLPGELHRGTPLFTELTNVDGDVSGVDTGLQLAHLGMVPPPPEQPRRLHSEVAHLHRIQTDVIDTRCAVGSHCQIAALQTRWIACA